jgi:hypothetical protein
MSAQRTVKMHFRPKPDLPGNSLNVHNALESGRTGDRGGGQHSTTTGHPGSQKVASPATGLEVQLT